MTDRELMQEAWETLNLVLAPFPVDDQRCMRVAKKLQERLAQPEPGTQARTLQSLRIGNYTLTRYDGGYWLAHASGEGMQVPASVLGNLVDELWKDF